MAERFPDKSRWCLIENVCQGVKCGSFLTVLRTGHCTIYELTFTCWCLPRCEANVTVAKTLANHTEGCSMKNRPNLVAMEIHIFANFGAGIIMSSWVWNSTTLLAWKRFFRRFVKDDCVSLQVSTQCQTLCGSSLPNPLKASLMEIYTCYSVLNSIRSRDCVVTESCYTWVA